jgi:hypothetical protein
MAHAQSFFVTHTRGTVTLAVRSLPDLELALDYAASRLTREEEDWSVSRDVVEAAWHDNSESDSDGGGMSAEIRHRSPWPNHPDDVVTVWVATD